MAFWSPAVRGFLGLGHAWSYYRTTNSPYNSLLTHFITHYYRVEMSKIKTEVRFKNPSSVPIF